MSVGTRIRHEQRGVALALLLWMLAGLSLLVAGIVSLSRSDVQLTSLQLDQARAQAVATGIAHAALRDLHALRLSGTLASGAQQSDYSLGGYSATVNVVPASGLINLNAADLALLSTLLQFGGGLQEEEARTLATAIVDWRSGVLVEGGELEEGGPVESLDSGRGPFLVEEALLAVPGMTRDLYEGIHRFVHTQPGAQMGVNLLAAPESLLNAWRSVDPEAVDFALQSRQDDARDEAPAGPVPGMVEGSTYLLEIDVRMADGKTFRQRIWVELSAAGGLPWRFSRVYPLALLPANSNEARFAI